MSLNVLEQADFSGGIWRDTDAPTTHVYDAVNALVDNRALIRRGGTSYKSVTGGVTGSTEGLFDGLLLGGRRTVFWTGTELWALLADDQTPFDIGTLYPAARPAVHQGVAYFPTQSGSEWWLIAYAGSRKPFYSTGTLTVSTGSTNVTGAGTAWLSNVDAGMFLKVGARALGPVERVLSDTSIQLAEGSQGNYVAQPYQAFASALIDNQWRIGETGISMTAAGGRLHVGFNNRVYESHGLRFNDNLVDFPSDSYVEIPEAGGIIGLGGVGSSVFVFSTRGVWQISNVAYDLTDDFGNVQQSVTQVSKEVVLWGDSGLASWGGQIIVPAIDDVYLFTTDSVPAILSQGIRSLYRSYVSAGYKPGKATTYRGHYVLPIMNGTTVVDVLLCRLDQGGTAWTRWANHALCSAFAVRVPPSTGTAPTLLATKGTRILDCSGCFTPAASNTTDADATAFQFSVTSSNFRDRRQSRPYFKYGRLLYDLTGTGTTITAEKATGDESSAFTVLDGAGPEDTSSSPFQWFVDERSERVRIRVASTGAPESLKLRSLEMHYRPSGKR